MEWTRYIEQRPEVMMGKPIIKGTCLTVELILESMSEGASESDLLAAHPNFRSEHIKAAFAYAAASLSVEKTLIAHSQE